MESTIADNLIHPDVLQWESWQIGELIGKGSTGQVYICSRMDRGVTYYSAVKHLHVPTLEQINYAAEAFGNDMEASNEYFEDMVDCIVKEITVMHGLSGHTHVVNYHDHLITKTISDTGRKTWNIFIRMEALKSLKGHMKLARMTLEEVIDMGIGVLKGLEACKRQGVIHRDVKEDNIFLDRFNTFKLGDFGISKDLSAFTRGVSIKGTPMYMAPEIIKGNVYNETVDTYALALLLYRLLNHNRLPFMPPYPQKITESHHKQSLNRRLNEECLELPVNAESTSLSNIIMHGIAFEKHNRYQSPTEFKIHLQQIKNELTYGQLKRVVTELTE